MVTTASTERRSRNVQRAGLSAARKTEDKFRLPGVQVYAGIAVGCTACVYALGGTGTRGPVPAVPAARWDVPTARGRRQLCDRHAREQIVPRHGAKP